MARPKTLKRQDSRAGLLFVLPALLLIIGFNTLPFLASTFYSLSKYTLGSTPKFSGLANYIEIFQNPNFISAFVVTLKMGFGVAVPGSLLAFIISLAINSGKKTGIFSTILFIPTIYPAVVVAFIWGAVYSGNGILNKFLGFQVDWLTSYNMALPSLILVIIWTNLGFYVVISLTGLKGIPTNVYEAASVDGANKWQQLRFITLPLVKPIILFIGVISIVNSFQLFTQPYLLTAGGPGNSSEVVAGLIYKTLFASLNVGSASAMSVVLAVTVLILSFIQFRILRDKE